MTANNQNAAGATTPAKNAHTRLAGGFDGPPSQSHSPMTSHGSRCPHGVWSNAIDRPALLTSIVVQFLDESSEIRSQYKEDDYSSLGSPHAASVSSPTSATGGGRFHQSGTPTSVLATPTEGFTVLSLLNAESPVLTPPPGHSVSHNQSVSTEPYHEDGTSTFVYQQPPGEPILWPLEHEQEAMLLQHYIENVALFVSATL